MGMVIRLLHKAQIQMRSQRMVREMSKLRVGMTAMAKTKTKDILEIISHLPVSYNPIIITLINRVLVPTPSLKPSSKIRSPFGRDFEELIPIFPGRRR